MDRLLAGALDVALDDAAEAQPRPTPRPLSRWPWHLAVAAVFALGIGSAVVLARAGKELPTQVLPAAVILPAPKVVRPASTLAQPTQPASEAPRSAPSEASQIVSSEHVRRLVGKAHPVRPSAAAEQPLPPAAAKKSKADDKIAPSPYTAPKAP
jgi:hypothetical protein